MKLITQIKNKRMEEELECAHMYLDDLNIPREDNKDTFSLVGRIKQLEKRYLKQMSEVEDYYLNNSAKIKIMKITEDTSSEMLRIEYNDKVLFYGNYWDFTRDGQTFKKLFDGLGLEVKLEEKPFEEW